MRYLNLRHKAYWLCLLLCTLWMTQSSWGQMPSQMEEPPFVCNDPDHATGKTTGMHDYCNNYACSTINQSGGFPYIFVRLRLHMFRNECGELGRTVDELQAEVDELNQRFAGTYNSASSLCTYATCDSRIRFCPEFVFYNSDIELFETYSNLSSTYTGANPNVLNMYFNVTGSYIAPACDQILGISMGYNSTWVVSPHGNLSLIMAHEIGHSLGLDHDNTYPCNIMYVAAGNADAEYFNPCQINHMRNNLLNVSPWTTMVSSLQSTPTAPCMSQPAVEVEAERLNACSGAPIAFKVITNSHVDEVTVYFGDGTSFTSTTPPFTIPAHSYSTAGSYVPTVTAINYATSLTYNYTHPCTIKVDVAARSVPYLQQFTNTNFYANDWWTEDDDEEDLTWMGATRHQAWHPTWFIGRWYCQMPRFVDITGPSSCDPTPNGAAVLADNRGARFWYRTEASLCTPDFDFTGIGSPTVQFDFSHVPSSSDLASPVCECRPNWLYSFPQYAANTYPLTGNWDNVDPICYGAGGCWAGWRGWGPCQEEEMFVEYSTNCGATWTQAPGGHWLREDMNTFIGGGDECGTHPFAPVSTQMWRRETFVLPSALSGLGQVRFRIRYLSGEGTNPIYVDDFMVYDGLMNITSTYSWGSTMTAPKEVHVYGTLDVTGVMLMLPESKIVVHSGGTLNLLGGAIMADPAYNKLWEGIVVDGGTVNGIPGSMVRDAEQAITTRNGGLYNLDGVTFEANYKGIVLESHPGTNPSVVTNCMFRGMPLLCPRSADRSRVGIEATKVGYFEIAGPGMMGNEFREMDLGVHLIASACGVYNNTFDMIDNPFGMAQTGFGIWVQDDGAIQGTCFAGTIAGNSGGNQFMNGYSGIVGTGDINIESRKNVFTNMAEAGIDVDLNTVGGISNSVAVISCAFSSMDHYGVRMLDNQNLQAYLEYNSISMNPTFSGTVAIFAGNGWISGASGLSYQIYHNWLSNAEIGIDLNSVQNVELLENSIVWGSSSLLGVQVQNANFITATGNQVNGAAGGGGEGFYANLSGDLDYQCNAVRNLGNGFHFFGTNVPSIWKGNLMDNDNMGLVLDGTGMISPQGTPTQHWDNKWSGAWTSATWCDNGGSNALYVRNIPMYNPTPHNGPSPIAPILVTYVPGVSDFPCYNGINLKTDGTEVSEWEAQLPFYQRIVQREVKLSETQYWAALMDIWMNSRQETGKSAEQLLQAPAFEPVAALMHANQAIAQGDAPSALKWLAGLRTPHVSLVLMERLVEIEAHALLEGQRPWTSEEVAEVEAIAQLCPAEYGKAVYQARVLLNRKLGKTMSQYGTDCDRGLEPTNRMVAEPEAVSALGIYPNPTQSDVTIAYNHGDREVDAFTLRIYSTLGVLVKEMAVMGQDGQLKARVSTEGLENGTYFVQIWVDGRAAVTGRLLKMD